MRRHTKKKHYNSLSHARNKCEYFLRIFVYYFQENAPVLSKYQRVTDVYCEVVNEFACKYIMWRQLYYYILQWVAQVTITYFHTV